MPSALARLGAVTDPLPAPLTMPAGSPDDAARALAQRVVAGGDDALAALLAALQASGVAVRGPADQLAIRPAEPWPGLIVESWEVRTMLATVLPERTVSFDFGDFAETVRAAVPALKDAPVAELLTQDLRNLAQGPASPEHFWARFVAELGHSTGDQPPLLAETDVAKIRLNGLQASLILRRLALDFLKRGGTEPDKQAASQASRRPWSLVEPLYAEALPCTLNSTERTIMDIVAAASKYAINGFKVMGVGFDGMLGYMDKSGFNGIDDFKSARGYASILLSYAKFIATYAALEVKISMDDAPLVRTKDVRPSAGERKDLTAVVRLNIGNAQMVNCFRIMLNAIGMDFKLPNDGPVKGAQIDWEGMTGFSETDAALHGGPDQIVRFVGDSSSHYQSGGAFTSFNSITKAVTDADGKARVTVEGVGQDDKLGQNARRQTKQATVRVNVALKGADLLGDLKDAASAGSGGAKSLVTLPIDILSRARWASAGHYTFDVIDWSDEGKWTGTISVSTTRTVVTSTQTAKSRGSSTDTYTMKAEIRVTQTISDQSYGGNTLGNMKASAHAHYGQRGTSSGAQIGAGCEPGQDLAFSGERQADGDANGEVQVVVVVSGGQVHLGVNSSGFQVPFTGFWKTDQQRAHVEGHISMKGSTRTCTVENSSPPPTPMNGSTGIGTVDVAGPADPKDPDHVHGTSTQTFGSDTTQTVTWDLRRG